MFWITRVMSWLRWYVYVIDKWMFARIE